MKLTSLSITMLSIAFMVIATSSEVPAKAVSDADKNPSSVLMSFAPGEHVVVACIGDSITAGVGSSAPANDYPSLLSCLLGMSFTVDNFGESGSTLLKNGDSPYWQRDGFKTSAQVAPNVVIIMLGTNDSKSWNWSHKSEFSGDYSSLIDYYSALPTHPKVFVCSPPPVPNQGRYGINEAGVLEEIPMIKEVAKEKKVAFIDVQSVVPNDSSYFVDDVHPNDAGYGYLAGAIYMGLTHSPAILPISSAVSPSTIEVTILAPSPTTTVHYTIDGTEPTRHSPTYTGLIKLSTPVTVKAEAFEGRKSFGLVSSTYYP